MSVNYRNIINTGSAIPLIPISPPNLSVTSTTTSTIIFSCSGTTFIPGTIGQITGYSYYYNNLNGSTGPIGPIALPPPNSSNSINTTISGLNSASNYNIYILANGPYDSVPSIANTYTYPTPPTTLKQQRTLSDISSIGFSFTPPVGTIRGYNAYYNTTPTTSAAIPAIVNLINSSSIQPYITVNNNTPNQLSSNTKYYIYLKSIGFSGLLSDYSQGFTLFTSPKPPTNLVKTYSDASDIQFTFTTSLDTIDDYAVYYNPVTSPATTKMLYPGTVKPSPPTATVKLTKLIPNTQYNISVYANNYTSDLSSSALNPPTSIYTNPAAPTLNSRIKALTTSSSIGLTFSDTNPQNTLLSENTYSTYYNTTGQATNRTTGQISSITGSPSQKSLVFTQLQSNTQYYVFLTTTNRTTSLTSDYSTPVPLYTAPAAPTNLTKSPTSNSITVSFTGQVDSYSVFYTTDPAYVPNATTPYGASVITTTTNNAIITTIQSNTQYYIYVYATNSTSDLSSTYATFSNKVYTRPTAPINLYQNIDFSDANNIVFTFNPTDIVDDYSIFYNITPTPNNAPLRVIPTPEIDAGPITSALGQLLSNTQYYLYLYGNNYQSDLSSAATIPRTLFYTYPTAPTNLSQINRLSDSSSITLSFIDPNPPVTTTTNYNYSVYYTTDPTITDMKTASLQTVPSGSNSGTTIKTLLPNSQYYLSIYANNTASNLSSRALSGQLNTGPAKPTQLTYNSTTSTSIDVSFSCTVNDGADAYGIYYDTIPQSSARIAMVPPVPANGPIEKNLTDLTPNSQYSIYVVGNNYGTDLSSSLLTSPKLVYTNPAAPNTLTQNIVTTTSTGIGISFKDTNPNITDPTKYNYGIYYSTNIINQARLSEASFLSMIPTIGSPIVATQMTMLTSNTPYNIYIYANNYRSDLSSTPLNGQFYTCPTNPTNLTYGKAVSDSGRIGFSFTNPNQSDPNTKNYGIYYSTSTNIIGQANITTNATYFSQVSSTSAIVTSLSPNTGYYVYVNTRNLRTNLSSIYSVSIPFYTYPLAVTQVAQDNTKSGSDYIGISITDTNPNSNQSSQNYGYRVHYGNAPLTKSNFATFPFQSIGIVNPSLKELPSNTPYILCVIVNNYQTDLSSIPFIPSTVFYTGPSQPTNLIFPSVYSDANRISFSFTAPSGQIDSYRVTYNTPNQPTTSIDIGKNTTATIRSLNPNTQYYLSVYAKNETSGLSSTALTLPPSKAIYTKPAQISTISQDKRSTDSNSISVLITDPNLPTTTSYNYNYSLFYTTDQNEPNPSLQIVTPILTTANTNTRLTELQPNKQYYVNIIVNNYTSDLSSIVFPGLLKTGPVTPTGLTFTSTTSSTIDILFLFNSPTDGADNYGVYYKNITGSGPSSVEKVVVPPMPTDDSTKIDTVLKGLSSNSQYNIYVVGNNYTDDLSSSRLTSLTPVYTNPVPPIISPQQIIDETTSNSIGFSFSNPNGSINIDKTKYKGYYNTTSNTTSAIEGSITLRTDSSIIINSNGLTPLSPNTPYYIYLKTTSSLSELLSDYSEAVPVYTAPSPPTNLTQNIVLTDDTSITISFTDNQNIPTGSANTYYAYFTSNSITTNAISNVATTRVKSSTPLSSNTGYTIYVTTTNSNSGLTSLSSSTIIGYTAPAVPTSLTPNQPPNATNSITFLFTPPPRTIDSYDIFYATNTNSTPKLGTLAGATQFVGTVNTASTNRSVTISNSASNPVSPNTQYYVYIYANANNSGTKLSSKPLIPITGIYTYPAALTNLTQMTQSTLLTQTPSLSPTTNIGITFLDNNNPVPTNNYTVYYSSVGAVTASNLISVTTYNKPITTSIATLTNLSSNALYYFYLTANNSSSRYSSTGLTGSFYTNPLSPTSLSQNVETTDSNNIPITFTDPNTIKTNNYSIYYTTNTPILTQSVLTTVTPQINGLTTTSTTITGLISSVSYYIYVYTKNTSSGFSTPCIPTSPFVTGPIAPTNITFSLQTYNSVTVSVTVVPNTASRYKITYTSVPSGSTTIQYTSGSTVTTNLTGLTSNSPYSITVAGQDAGATGPFSTKLISTTYTAPAAPTALTQDTTTTTATVIGISFTDNNPNRTVGQYSYDLYYSTSQITTTIGLIPIVYNPIDTEYAKNTTINSETPLTANTKYYVYLIANSSISGQSVSSTGITTTTGFYTSPATPTGLSQTSVQTTTNQIGISFTDKNTVFTNLAYKIDYTIRNGETQTMTNPPTPQTTVNAVIKSLLPNSQYAIAVFVNNPSTNLTSLSIGTSVGAGYYTNPAAPSIAQDADTTTSTVIGIKITDSNYNINTNYSYQIYYSTGIISSTTYQTITPTNFAPTTTSTSNNQTIYTTISPLTSATTYYIGLISKNTAVTPNLLSLLSIVTSFSTGPAVPTAVSLVSVTDTSITVTFTALSISTTASIYYIQSGNSSSSLSRADIIRSGGIQFTGTLVTTGTTITGLYSNYSYYIYIAAISSNNIPSTYITTATPFYTRPAVPDLVLDTATETSIVVKNSSRNNSSTNQYYNNATNAFYYSTTSYDNNTVNDIKNIISPNPITKPFPITDIPNTPNSLITLSDLTPNTRYYLYLVITSTFQNSTLQSYNSTSPVVYTYPTTPTIKDISTTYNSITFTPIYSSINTTTELYYSTTNYNGNTASFIKNNISKKITITNASNISNISTTITNSATALIISIEPNTQYFLYLISTGTASSLVSANTYSPNYPSNVTGVYTSPQQPISITYTSSDTDRITFTFTDNNLAGSCNYDVGYRTAANGLVTYSTRVDSITTVTITGLNPETSYYAAVSAVPKQIGAPTAYFIAATSYFTLPSPPTQVSCIIDSDKTSSTYSNLIVTVTPPTPATLTDTYKIYVSPDNIMFTPLATQNISVSATYKGSYSNTLFVPNIFCFVKAKTISTTSKNGSAFIESAHSSTTNIFTYPLPPTTVTYVSSDSSSVTFTFTNPPQNTNTSYGLDIYTKYNVYYQQTTNPAYKSIADTTYTQFTGTITPSSAIINGLEPDTSYRMYFTIANTGYGGESPPTYTSICYYTNPPAPTGLTATSSAGQINISFTKVTGYTYNAYYSTSSTLTSPVKFNNAISNAASTLASLTSNTLYYIYVTAYNSSTTKTSVKSDVLTQYTAPGQPIINTAPKAVLDAATTDSITFSFSANNTTPEILSYTVSYQAFNVTSGYGDMIQYIPKQGKTISPALSIIENLSADTKYKIYVTAVNNNQAGVKSSGTNPVEGFFTSPIAPQITSDYLSSTSNSITVSITYPVGNLSYYVSTSASDITGITDTRLTKNNAANVVSAPATSSAQGKGNVTYNSLNSDTQYYLYVITQSSTSSIYSKLLAGVSQYTTPIAPTLNTIYTSSSNAITFSFTALTPVNLYHTYYYDAYYSLNNALTAPTFIGRINPGTGTLTGNVYNLPSSNTPYYIFITTYNYQTGLSSANSSPLAAYTNPDPPTNITYSTSDKANITVTYTKTTGMDCSYVAHYRKSTDTTAQLYATKFSSTVATVATLSPNTAYYISLSAYNNTSIKESVASSELLLYTNPAPATDFTLVSSDSTSITFKFTDPNPTNLYYVFYSTSVKTPPAPLIVNGAIQFPNVTQFTGTISPTDGTTIIDLLSNTSYYIYIYVYSNVYENNNWTLLPSTGIASTVYYTNPATPTITGYVTSDYKSVTFNFTGIAGLTYTAYYNKDPAQGKIKYTTKTFSTGSSVTVDGLDSNTLYYFYLLTSVTNGTTTLSSAYSPAVSFTTNPFRIFETLVDAYPTSLIIKLTDNNPNFEQNKYYIFYSKNNLTPRPTIRNLNGAIQFPDTVSRDGTTITGLDPDTGYYIFDCVYNDNSTENGVLTTLESIVPDSLLYYTSPIRPVLTEYSKSTAMATFTFTGKVSNCFHYVYYSTNTSSVTDITTIKSFPQFGPTLTAPGQVTITGLSLQTTYYIYVISKNKNTKISSFNQDGLSMTTTAPMLCIAFGDGTNTLAYSTDSLTWVGLGTTVFTSYGFGAAYGNGVWVAGGYSGGTGNTLAYSTNGTTWVGLGTSIFSSYGQGQGVGYGNGVWVAAGRLGNSLAYSTNGTTWVGLAKTTFTTNGNGVSYGNGVWVATGQGGNNLAYSTDNAVTWTGLGTSIFTTYGWGVAYGNGVWVAAGSGGNSLAYSTDGVTWQGLALTIFTNWGIGVAYGNSVWVAGGFGGNSLAYSTDGVKWTGLGTSIFSSLGRGVAYGNGVWVAGGLGGNSLAYSADGLTWFGLNTTVFTIGGFGVAFM